jgi:lipopolysaccharide transport system ATP-binding protein
MVPASVSKLYVTDWALKDVSFDVLPGERLGIIGPNGAGKTTLLKLIGRITSPSEGQIRLRGRVASLLEVGTGFHPELTGRENIFLNGSILGLSHREIKSRFDEIVNFTEMETFLDTPVKRYSSGMYVRLAFAVAAHLDSDILLVDEILAVGDATFQKKCLGKMDEISKNKGRSIIFVSHDLRAIRFLCSSAILINHGKAEPKKNVEQVLQDYALLNSREVKLDFPICSEEGEMDIEGFKIYQDENDSLEFLGEGEMKFEIKFKIKKTLDHFRVGVVLKNEWGMVLSRMLLADWNPHAEDIQPGLYCLTGKIRGNFLVPGVYSLCVHGGRFGLADYGFESKTEINFRVLVSTQYNELHVGENAVGSFIFNPEWKMVAL